MNSLEKSVELVLRWPTSRNAQRAEVISHLEAIIKDCRAALAVWQAYLDNPGAPGARWALITWLGPERVKQLHEINLSARSHLKALADTAGPEAGRFILFEEDVIEMAYRQLPDGETGLDAAQASITVMNERIARLNAWVQRLRGAKPPAAKAAPKAIKKTAGPKTTRLAKKTKPRPAPKKK